MGNLGDTVGDSSKSNPRFVIRCPTVSVGGLAPPYLLHPEEARTKWHH